LVTLQSTVKIEKPETSWLDVILHNFPGILLTLGLGGTAWWQYRSFTTKKEKPADKNVLRKGQ